MSDVIDTAISEAKTRLATLRTQLGTIGDTVADVSDVSSIDTRTQASGANGASRTEQILNQITYWENRIQSLSLPRQFAAAQGVDEVGNVLDVTVPDES